MATTRYVGVKARLHKQVFGTHSEFARQRITAEKLARRVITRTWREWYSVTTQQIREHGGGALLQLYKSSPAQMLQALYPEYPWMSWKFHAVSKGYWYNTANKRVAVEQLARQCGVREWSEWYQKTSDDVRCHGGGGLLKHHNNSLPQLLHAVFPELPWKSWKFQRTSKGYWNDLRRQREVTEDLATQLHVREWCDWYEVTPEQVREAGAGGLLQVYGKSLAHMLEAVHPEIPWSSWRFSKKMQAKHLAEHSGDELADPLVLSSPPFPGHPSSSPSTSFSSSSFPLSLGEISLRLALECLLPHHTPLYNYKENTSPLPINSLHRLRSHTSLLPGLFHPTSGLPMELDVYFLELNIAFEYQGKQHYHANSYHGDARQQQQRRDREKQEACALLGITLIPIPYWWDETVASLAATIKHYRSDITLSLGEAPDASTPTTTSTTSRTATTLMTPMTLCQHQQHQIAATALTI